MYARVALVFLAVAVVRRGVTKPYYRVDAPAVHGTAQILFVATHACRPAPTASWSSRKRTTATLP
jgi:hypothetical protein